MEKLRIAVAPLSLAKHLFSDRAQKNKRKCKMKMKNEKKKNKA